MPSIGVSVGVSDGASDGAADGGQRPPRQRLRRRLVGGAVIGLLTSLSVGMVLTFEMVLANERRSLDRELLEQREHFESDMRERLDAAPVDLTRPEQRTRAMREFLELAPDAAEVITVLWSGNGRLGSTASDPELEQLVASGRFDALPVGRLATVHTVAGDLRALRVEVRDGPDVVGSIAVAGPLAPARSEAFEALRRLALAAIVSLLVGWFVVEVAVRRVLRPLGRLTDAAASTEMHRFAGAVHVEGDDEVSELTREFNAMIVRLDDASVERERLLATISHELRTPLAVARAKLELAERAHLEARSAGVAAAESTVGRPGRGDDEVRASLVVARGELERMSRLVGDLLALGRSGHRGFLHRRPVDLRDLVRELEVRIDGLGWDTVTVAPAPALVVEVDAERLMQAMSNCVQNAIVHNPPGTTVDVLLSVVSDRLVIRVVDDGVGIPVADRARVLEPFVHLGTGVGQTSTGLGLAVVAATAAAHGGVVRILDAPAETEPFETAPFETEPFETAPFETEPFDAEPFDTADRARPRSGSGTMVEISFPVTAGE